MCLLGNCTCNRPGSGTVNRTGISYVRSGYCAEISWPDLAAPFGCFPGFHRDHQFSASVIGTGIGSDCNGYDCSRGI